MREIKFRAWDKKNNCWFFGYELPNLGGFSMFGEIMMMGEWAQLLSSRFPNDTKEIALMQYTGLKDKNGKEIYEGDMVKGREGTVKGVIEFGAYTKGRSHKHDSQTEHVGWYVQTKDGKVSLEDLEWYIKPTNYAPFRGQYLEVIGNVYENENLLTKE